MVSAKRGPSLGGKVKKWFGRSAAAKETHRCVEVRETAPGLSRWDSSNQGTAHGDAEPYKMKTFALPEVKLTTDGESEWENSPKKSPNPNNNSNNSNEVGAYNTYGRPQQLTPKPKLHGGGFNTPNKLRRKDTPAPSDWHGSLTTSASAHFDNTKFRKVNEFTPHKNSQKTNAAPSFRQLGESQSVPVFFQQEDIQPQSRQEVISKSSLPEEPMFDDIDEEFMDSILED